MQALVRVFPVVARSDWRGPACNRPFACVPQFVNLVGQVAQQQQLSALTEFLGRSWHQFEPLFAVDHLAAV
jgi:hypothetical protein